jgi:hypothetical protein
MPIPEPLPRYWTHDEACAWVVWRNLNSVALAKKDGFKRLWRRRVFYDLPPETTANWRMDDDGAPPPFAAPRDPPANLEKACVEGRIQASGRFDGGKREPIHELEWLSGSISPKWSDILFEVIQVKNAFPRKKPRGTDHQGCIDTSIEIVKKQQKRRGRPTKREIITATAEFSLQKGRMMEKIPKLWVGVYKAICDDAGFKEAPAGWGKDTVIGIVRERIERERQERASAEKIENR